MRSQRALRLAPIAVLLAVIVCLEAWFLATRPQLPKAEPTPELTAITGAVYFFVGFLAGLLGGIIGTGGCSVMLPIIHFWGGFPATMAIGTTLFAVIFTAISGGYGHLVRRNVDQRAAAWLGGVGILGVLLGSWLFVVIAKQAVKLLGLVLGAVFLWPAVRMVYEGLMPWLKKGAAAKGPEGSTIPGHGWALGAFGFIVGITTGLVGLGGGYALVPGLIYLFGAPVYITMGTSLAVMIPLALVGGLIKLFQGFVDFAAGCLLAIGTIIGAQLGAAIIRRFRPTTLKLIFGAYFLYVSLKFITGYFGIMIW